MLQRKMSKSLSVERAAAFNDGVQRYGT
jgi:hypothetical protein